MTKGVIKLKKAEDYDKRLSNIYIHVGEYSSILFTKLLPTNPAPPTTRIRCLSI